MEASLAVLLLAGLALFGPGRHAGSVPVVSGAVRSWTSSALPIISNLINDSSAIEHDSDPAATIAPGARRSDAARYDLDLAAAQRLPVPPVAGLAQEWRSTLSKSTLATLDLETIGSANPAVLARAHVRFAAVETVLLEFQQAIRPAH